MVGIVVNHILYVLSHLICIAISELDTIAFMLQMRKPSLKDAWGLAQYHTIRQ